MYSSKNAWGTNCCSPKNCNFWRLGRASCFAYTVHCFAKRKYTTYDEKSTSDGQSFSKFNFLLHSSFGRKSLLLTTCRLSYTEVKTDIFYRNNTIMLIVYTLYS